MEKIQIKEGEEGLVLINEVEANWPCLTKKSRRYDKYSLAIELEANDASKLRAHMQRVHEEFLFDNPEHSDKPSAEFGVDLGNGRMKFNLQNRQDPVLLNPDGTTFIGKFERGSSVRLLVKVVNYVNTKCGVSLRVMGVEVISSGSDADFVRELFGHPASNDAEDSIDEWNEADRW